MIKMLINGQVQTSSAEVNAQEVIDQIRNSIQENAMRAAALLTCKEIQERFYQPYVLGAFGEQNDIYVIQQVSNGINKTYTELPIAIQAVEDLSQYVQHLNALLQSEKVNAAFAIFGLPVRPITPETIQRVLRQKLDSSEPGVLIPGEKRVMFFDAADTIKQSPYFVCGQMTKVSQASGEDYILWEFQKELCRVK